MSEYLKPIKNIIAKISGVEPSEIASDSFFRDDLNVGDMELIEILQEIEEKSQVDLADNIDDIESVQDVIDLIIEQVE